MPLAPISFHQPRRYCANTLPTSTATIPQPRSVNMGQGLILSGLCCPRETQCFMWYCWNSVRLPKAVYARILTRPRISSAGLTSPTFSSSALLSEFSMGAKDNQSTRSCWFPPAPHHRPLCKAKNAAWAARQRPWQVPGYWSLSV